MTEENLKRLSSSVKKLNSLVIWANDKGLLVKIPETYETQFGLGSYFQYNSDIKYILNKNVKVAIAEVMCKLIDDILKIDSKFEWNRDPKDDHNLDVITSVLDDWTRERLVKRIKYIYKDYGKE